MKPKKLYELRPIGNRKKLGDKLPNGFRCLRIYCPECMTQTHVFHMEWHALRCNCEKDIRRTQFLRLVEVLK